VKAVYRGHAAELFLVMIRNLFLTMITAGLYLPWARAAQRRYIWKHVEIGRERLEYTGTGLGLVPGLLPWLVLPGAEVLVVRFVPAARAHPRAWLAVVVAAAVVLAPFALYFWLRHLIRNTRWRGVRFDLAGSPVRFTATWIAGAALALVTLGIGAPLVANRLYAAVARNIRYGAAPFAYDGRDRDALRIGIKGILLSLVTLGVYRFWYHAALWRFRAGHTRFGAGAGRLDVTGGLLLRLALLNLFANLISLGLTVPWTLSYTLRVLLARTSYRSNI
jgi:uncharacterized membrane protein YjgN (DUF898 family)